MSNLAAGRVAAAMVAVFCAGVVVVPTAAQAAIPTCNIMLIGSSIRSGVGSVALSLEFTGSHDGQVLFQLFGDSKRFGASKGVFTRRGSSSITTKNWWVSLS